MSTSVGETQLCDTKPPNCVSMDSLPFNLNRPQNDQFLTHPRPVSVNLSKLAELISRIEYKPKHQQSSICKDCGQTFPNLKSLVDHQSREHTQNLHSCERCGQKFTLLASLQLHDCPGPSSICQDCGGKPQHGSSCSSCGAKSLSPCLSEESFHHDNSNYVCEPCGQAFSHKQELLYHQQDGGCQSGTGSSYSPSATSTTSSSFSSPSPSRSKVSASKCDFCSRTFRSPAGLSCHVRFFHEKRKNKPRSFRETTRVTISDTSFPCRSCDKVFSKTSLLYLHRKEEHRREIIVRKPLRNSGRTSRQRRKCETYPCLHCGKVFLHHLTRYAHFRQYSSHHQAHLALSSKAGLKPSATGAARSLKQGKLLKRGRPRTKPRPTSEDSNEEEVTDTDTDVDADYPCLLCESVFSSKAELKAHKKVHETADASKCCTVCTGGRQLSEIPEKCECQSKGARSLKGGKRGRPRTKPRPASEDSKEWKETDTDTDVDAEYPCLLCKSVFSSKAELKAHKKVHETADVSKCCTVCTGGIKCECQSRGARSLKRGKRGRPRTKPRPASEDSEQKDETDTDKDVDAEYPCLLCESVFSSQAELKAHEKVHETADVPKGCSMCTIPENCKCNVFQSRDAGSVKGGKRGRPMTKPHPASEDTKQQQKEETDTDTDVDAEYSCLLCESIFCSQTVLKAHEKVHESENGSKCCSVCAGGIKLSDIPENCESKVYHCVPCAETFVALETFLDHCKKHLIRESEEDEDLLSDY